MGDIKFRIFCDIRRQKWLIHGQPVVLTGKNSRVLCPNFVALFSKDDPDVPFDDNKPIFEKELGAKLLRTTKGHFTSEKGVNELPEVLEELLRMTN